MRSSVLAVAVVWVGVASSGCVKSAPPAALDAPVDAGPSEAALLAPKLDAVEAEIADVVRQTDEQLWKLWLQGTPTAFPAVMKAHPGLVTKETLALLAKARTLRPEDAQRITALERWVVAEWLVRATTAESESLATLEAATTFQVEGKDVALRDLGKVLLNEQSAVKRRAVWAASHEAVQRVETALDAREKKVAAELAALGLPPPIEWAAAANGQTLEQVAALAEQTLASTEGEWQETLARLADAEVKLPVQGLSRADLPRLLRVPAAVDAEFPRQKVALRLVQTLGTRGVYGKPGLTLDLAEAARKNPLPLTVAPTPGDVRVSLRPLGGLKDQRVALSEVGAALALFEVRTEPLTRGRLGPPLLAQRSAEALAALLLDRDWLTANEVKNVEAVIAAARAQQLFGLRRAAGLVLARIEGHRAADDDAARAAFVSTLSRALGFPVPAAEGVRWRIETDDFLRHATLLLAAQPRN